MIMKHTPKKVINVLQFICPTGFYGAERWILALVKNSDPNTVNHELAVTYESEKQNLELLHQFPKANQTHKITMNGRFDWQVIKKLVSLIKQRNIDIIHTHGYKSDILGVIAARKAGIKSVATPHGFGTSKELKLQLFTWLGGKSLSFFDKVVPLSKQLYKESLDYGVAKDKCFYIRNAVDLTEIDEFLVKKTPYSKTDAKAEKKQIGFIGQLIPRKNVKDAIDIFDTLWQNDKNIEFNLLGDGESRQELERYANSLASAQDIHFLGFRNDRLERLKDLSLFVMTSEDEGIPRCLMEACAMEIPIAAYDIAGIDQLISHQKTGLLAPFGDKKQLALHWRQLLDDADYAQTLARAARAFVLEKFSGQRMAKEYHDLFRQLLQSK